MFMDLDLPDQIFISPHKSYSSTLHISLAPDASHMPQDVHDVPFHAHDTTISHENQDEVNWGHNSYRPPPCRQHAPIPHLIAHTDFNMLHRPVIRLLSSARSALKHIITPNALVSFLNLLKLMDIISSNNGRLKFTFNTERISLNAISNLCTLCILINL